MDIKVPSINMEFTPLFGSETFPTAQYVWKTYGSIISAASGSLGVDKKIIVGFMIIESGRFNGSGTVNEDAVSPVGAKGLMQLMPKTAYETIVQQAPVMDGKSAAVIQKYVPGLLKTGGFTGSYSEFGSKVDQKLFVAEFNIWVGTMQLAQLMKYCLKKTGTVNLAQVVVMYNAGIGNYDKWVVGNNLQKADSKDLIKGLQEAQGLKESRQYIVKLLGVNGSMVAAAKVV